MAQKIPGPLERRHLLERSLSTEQAIGYAEAYLAEDRKEEAIGFLAKAGATEQLAALAQAAEEEGNVFLYREANLARGFEPGPEDWERVERAARAAGHELYADAAQRQSGRHEES